jgi:hypothetical protein
MEAGLSPNHFFGSSGTAHGKVFASAPRDQRRRAGFRVGWETVEMGENGAHQAVGEIAAFRQAKSVEFDPDRLCKMVADGIAVGKPSM